MTSIAALISAVASAEASAIATAASDGIASASSSSAAAVKRRVGALIPSAALEVEIGYEVVVIVVPSAVAVTTLCHRRSVGMAWEYGEGVWGIGREAQR